MIKAKDKVGIVLILAFTFAILGFVSACHCGDGAINQDWEECDDGNIVNGDGCSYDCQIEFCGDEECNNWETCSTCSEDCGICEPECGDDICNGDETCSTCSEDCGICEPECGNGLKETGEQCDDGNLINGDGCSSTCTTECKPYCGDGIINQANETCDDGNLANNDGCSSTCKIERCGDNIKQINEECDDGNLINNDGCSSACKNEFCGDNKCNNQESCSTCSEDCGICEPECGNGLKETGEQCDDGNLINGDGCSNTCQDECNFCGDNICNGDETCSSCPGDCGICPTPEPECNLNHFVQFCNTNWKCSGWSECSNGMATRDCVDKNNCDVEYNKPHETSECKGNAILNSQVKYDNVNYLWLIIVVILLLLLLIVIFNLVR